MHVQNMNELYVSRYLFLCSLAFPHISSQLINPPFEGSRRSLRVMVEVCAQVPSPQEKIATLWSPANLPFPVEGIILY